MGSLQREWCELGCDPPVFFFSISGWVPVVLHFVVNFSSYPSSTPLRATSNDKIQVPTTSGVEPGELPAVPAPPPIGAQIYEMPAMEEPQLVDYGGDESDLEMSKEGGGGEGDVEEKDAPMRAAARAQDGANLNPQSPKREKSVTCLALKMAFHRRTTSTDCIITMAATTRYICPGVRHGSFELR